MRAIRCGKLPFERAAARAHLPTPPRATLKSHSHSVVFFSHACACPPGWEVAFFRDAAAHRRPGGVQARALRARASNAPSRAVARLVDHRLRQHVEQRQHLPEARGARARANVIASSRHPRGPRRTLRPCPRISGPARRPSSGVSSSLYFPPTRHGR